MLLLQRRRRRTWGHSGRVHTLVGETSAGLLCLFPSHSNRTEGKPLSAPWNLLSRLETSSTASLTAWIGSDTIWWMSVHCREIVIIFVCHVFSSFLFYCFFFYYLPGTALYSTKSNITTPTASQDKRATRAMSSSADIFSFLRSPRPLDLREVFWGGAATALDTVAARREEPGAVRCLTHMVTDFQHCLTNFPLLKSTAQTTGNGTFSPLFTAWSQYDLITECVYVVLFFFLQIGYTWVGEHN